MNLMKPPTPEQIVIGKYSNGRFWAVWVRGELLAVVVYKKGAEAIKLALLNLSTDKPERDS